MSKSQSETLDDIDALKADLVKVKDDLASLAGNLMDKGKESAKAVRASVEQKFNSSLESVGEFVEERPVTTVLLAFGAGVVTAMLLRRK